MHRSETAELAQRFYQLKRTDATKYIWCRVTWDSLQGRGRFPRQLVGFDGLVLLTVNTGTVAPDIIGNDALLLIVSDRVVEILRSYHITGWTTYAVRISRNGGEIRGYKGLGISGRGGSNDPKAHAGGLVKGTTIQKVEGLLPTQWDGTDLFTLDDVPGAVLATNKVRGIFKKERVTNCKFRSAEEFAIGRGMD